MSNLWINFLASEKVWVSLACYFKHSQENLEGRGPAKTISEVNGKEPCLTIEAASQEGATQTSQQRSSESDLE